MVVDCGNKLHLSNYDRQTTPSPSNFVTKLRKHLKTRRVTAIKQVQNDRVVVFQFSEGLYYLVMEFFSAGNILLLDEQRKILSLQRLVSEKENNDRYAVNETYNMFDESLFTSDFVYQPAKYTTEEVKSWIAIENEKLLNKITAESTKKKQKVPSINKLLFLHASHLSSELILKELEEKGVNGSGSALEFLSDDESLVKIVEALTSAEITYQDFLNTDKEVVGVIVAKKNPNFDPRNQTGASSDSLEYIYDEFHPFKPFKRDPQTYQFIDVQGYNNTLDKFFVEVESSKYSIRIEQTRLQAEKRLQHARNEKEKQIQSLAAQKEAHTKKGETLIHFANVVEDCKAFIQTMLDQQMDWTNMEKYIQLEQSKGNKIANTIKLPLNLTSNKITLALPDIDELDDESYLEDDKVTDLNSSDTSELDWESSSESEEDSDDDEDDDEKIVKRKGRKQTLTSKRNTLPHKKLISVAIDIGLSAFANASTYFDSKKSAESKQDKVEKKTSIALKNAERKIQSDLAQKLKFEPEAIKHIRPKFWFEKFYWFISNEGYLCIAGRDDSQTDMIYYRHLNDNDCLVSSDVIGSLKVFVKNPYSGQKVPPSTLMQAGVFALSASDAWSNKITTSAWVLEVSEISKRGHGGQFLPEGQFEYKTQKEFLAPSQVVMGFGLYWLVDEATAEKYKATREQKQKDFKIVSGNVKKELEGLRVAYLEKEKEKSTHTNGKFEEVKETSEPGQVLKKKEEEEVEAESTVTSDNESVSDSVVQLQKAKVRGKKGKMKKIAQKYADQDDEERVLRMDALGTLKQKQQIEADNEARIKKEENSKKLQIINAQLAAERRKKQSEREFNKYLLGTTDEDEEESGIENYLEIMDYMVSKPQPTDNVYALVPVFGPWQAFQKFKYKVKFQPGTGKKGKAMSDALHWLTSRKMDLTGTDTDIDWQNERDILLSTKHLDLIGCFTVNKVKLVLPNGNESVNKSKGQSLGKNGSKKGGKKGKK